MQIVDFECFAMNCFWQFKVASPQFAIANKFCSETIKRELSSCDWRNEQSHS